MEDAPIQTDPRRDDPDQPERLPGKRVSSFLQAGDAHPLLPWLPLPLRGLQLEYQVTEIRLTGSGARLRSLRRTLRDGEIREERLQASLGPEAFAEAAEQMQRQSLALMEGMMTGLMAPWLAPFSLFGGAPGRAVDEAAQAAKGSSEGEDSKGSKDSEGREG
ncbi:hypothetical protein [Motiliproteus sp. SC1-56]|uniref:hypothetical protein n=1 Tax=Motiliproteus sp. SC1-56 TaxID=2799565 RepID=UPI001A8CE8F5|nr:hypothetical protein [Motiliproteus sp. SC1-56]